MSNGRGSEPLCELVQVVVHGGWKERRCAGIGNYCHYFLRDYVCLTRGTQVPTHGLVLSLRFSAVRRQQHAWQRLDDA